MRRAKKYPIFSTRQWMPLTARISDSEGTPQSSYSRPLVIASERPASPRKRNRRRETLRQDPPPTLPPRFENLDENRRGVWVCYARLRVDECATNYVQICGNYRKHGIMPDIRMANTSCIQFVHSYKSEALCSDLRVIIFAAPVI